MITIPTKAETSVSIKPKPVRRRMFLLEFIRLAGPFWHSGKSTKIRTLTFALIALTVAQVVINVVITEWSARLFDSIEQHSMQRFLLLIGVLGLIIVANMSVTAGHLIIKRRIQIDWRTWLTDRLLGHWMTEGRHYQVSYLPGEHDNPDSRIAEDIRISTENAVDLCHSLVFCILLVIGFGRVLWNLSGVLVVPIGTWEITIYGHLVWIAIIYATAAAFLGWSVGRSLIRATNSRQTAEANFRFGLVRARENSEAIALVHGETDERRRLLDLFRSIVVVWQQQTHAFFRIMMFTSGYSVVNTGFPVLIAAPRYITGSITLGMLVQSAQAFQQFAAALSWPVDNLARMAEWRASVERVLGLDQGLREIDDETARGNATISVDATEQSALVFRKVCVANPDGDVVIENLDARIEPGERVLISGDASNAGKLFKAVAGLWPWGCGQIELPAGVTMYFMPPRPYLPIGSLRDAFCYPSPPDTFDAASIENMLTRVGLDHLAHKLEEVDNWEKVLTLEEQQKLGFASLLLHKPKWVLLQESLDAIDGAGQEAMLRLLVEVLPHAAIVSVSHQPLVQNFHSRQIELQRNQNGKPSVKPTRIRRQAERRGHTDLSWQQQLIGSLRSDRRRTAD